MVSVSYGTETLMEMFPSFSGHNSMNMNEGNVVQHSNRSLRHSLAVKFADVKHGFLGKFTHWMTLTRIVGAMQFFMLFVLGVGRPHNMLGIYAKLISAQVRCLSFGWWWPIRVYAHEAAHGDHAAIFSDQWATVRIQAIGPVNAIFCMLGLSTLKKGSGLMSLCSHMSNRVAHYG